VSLAAHVGMCQGAEEYAAASWVFEKKKGTRNHKLKSQKKSSTTLSFAAFAFLK